MSEQERSAAQADLDRLTGELVRLYQLREQLKLALTDGEGAAAVGVVGGAPSAFGDVPAAPSFQLVVGQRDGELLRDDAQRQTLRSQFQIIRGGLS